MKENMMKVRDKAKTYWMNRTKTQKGIMIGSLLAVILAIIFISLFATNAKFVPLYNNLSLQEAGQIKTELDARKIPYELADGGRTILVPEEQADMLLVDFAGQGIPDSGNIDYSFFSENASWGITDNEFDIMKLDAMQTELANLIKGIDGIENAKVMINMPKDPVFVSEEIEPASASIVIHTKPGYKFQGNQINSLYTLVSKAVPNLSPDNIVIMNQYFEYFDRNVQNGNDSTEDGYNYQQTVKQDIERDIQRRVQQMLGTIVGMENVIVSVTADIDFTKENRVEELVEPVDEENMEGLPVSIESIQESYTGNPPVGGTAGTGEGDIANYEAGDTGENGDYEMVKETVNNEFNRIRKDIVESPYKIRDLGIQVAVDNVVNRTGDEVEYLSQQDQNVVEDGIASILNSIISTSVDKEYGEINPEEKTSIIFQEFAESAAIPQEKGPSVPLWMYIIGGILLIAVIALIIVWMRRKRNEEEDEASDLSTDVKVEVPDIAETEESETVLRRKQLEKMAKEKPEEFAKLLRGWIGED